MTDIRWKDNPKLAALAGTERIPATSTVGGAKDGGGTISANGDIHVTMDDIKAFANKVPAGGDTGQVLKKASGADYNVIWAAEAGSGGGGGGGGWRPAIPVSITLIDDLSANPLSGDWVTVDDGDSGKQGWDWIEGSITGWQGNTTAYHMSCLLLPIASAGGALSVGDAFVTRVENRGVAGAYPCCGLVISNGSTYGSGSQCTATVVPSHSSINKNAASSQTTSNFSSRSSYTGDVTISGHSALWVRLVKTSSTTYRTDVSANGRSWQQVNSISYSETVSHAGLFVVMAANNDAQGCFEFQLFGRMSGVGV